MKNVLLLKAGEAAAPLKLATGDYDRWFLESTGQWGVRFTVVQAYLNERLPAARRFDAVWMTGSPLSVTQKAPWMLRAADYLRDAAEGSTPVLGVCFGHQLLASAYGAAVAKNPHGREIGSVDVELTPAGQADPLFEGLPPRFTVQTTHEDEVTAVPQGAVVLAGNAHCAIQAFAVGRTARAVQFHPELQPGAMKALIQVRAPLLEAEAQARGAPPGERTTRLLSGVRPSPFAQRVLSNFLQAFV